MTIIFFFLFIQFFLYFQAFNNSLLPSLLPKTMLGSSCFYRQQVDEETETFKKKPRQTCPISKSKTVLKVNNKAKFRLKHSISNSQNKIKFLFSSNFFFFFILKQLPSQRYHNHWNIVPSLRHANSYKRNKIRFKFLGLGVDIRAFVFCSFIKIPSHLSHFSCRSLLFN